MKTHTVLLQSQAKPQRGFTLMEVLIAMAIGLVVLVGALSYFGRGVKSIQTADTTARLHEGATRAAAMLARDLQLAGFYGYGGSAQPSNVVENRDYDYGERVFHAPYPGVSGVSIPADCGAVNVTALGRPIEYYHTTAVLPSNYAASTCVPNAEANTPILVTRGALTGEKREYRTMTEQSGDGKTLLVSATPYVTLNIPNVVFFFDNTGITSSTTPESVPVYVMMRAMDAGLLPKRMQEVYMPVFPYQFHVHYIRTCSVEADSGTDACDTTKGAVLEPTLVRRELLPGSSAYSNTLGTARMMPGVQAMNFVWGMDTRGDKDKTTDEDIGDGVTDYWKNSISANDFNRVNAVRIQLLMQSPVPDGSHDDKGNTYFFDNDSTTGYTCAGELCKRRRMLFETITSVRNCSLRRRAGFVPGGEC